MSNLPRSLKASNERKMRVFMASDASDWNVGKGSLEVILGEGEIWHEQVMRRFSQLHQARFRGKNTSIGLPAFY
jgi:hypothetical protein